MKKDVVIINSGFWILPSQTAIRNVFVHARAWRLYVVLGFIYSFAAGLSLCGVRVVHSPKTTRPSHSGMGRAGYSTDSFLPLAPWWPELLWFDVTAEGNYLVFRCITHMGLFRSDDVQYEDNWEEVSLLNQNKQTNKNHTNGVMESIGI